jgi:tRNA threonylcarbamoyladenosine biosynthesis protein TsaB
MRILAFETTAKAGSVALWQDGTLLAESYQNTGLTHSQTLLTMAQQLLAGCGLTAGDVEAVAVAAGPGSFTGVRIGVAAAKGVAWGGEIPLYGVSTLEAMALGLGISEGYVLAVMDARRNQVYTALFQAEAGSLTRLCPDRAISLEALLEEIKNLSGPVFLVGDGSILCYNTLREKFPGLICPPEHKMHQRAAGVALGAEKAIAQGLPGDSDALKPNYLRLSQAERERLAREQK